MITSEKDLLQKKINSLLNYFWVGFSLYSIAFVFPAKIQIMVLIHQGLQLFGILLFVPAAFSLINWKEPNNYLKTIAIILLFWNLTVLMRGWNFGYEFIKRMLVASNDGLFMYLLPFLVFFPNKFSSLKKIYNAIIIFGLFFIVSYFMEYQVLMFAIKGSRNATGTVDVLIQCLAVPAGYILLTHRFHTNKRKIMAIIIVLLSLYLSIVRARRGLMYVNLSLIVFSYIIFVLSNTQKLLKFFISVTMLLILVSGAVLFYTIQKNGFFGYFTSRVDEDTRKGVEIAFYNDMDLKDWIMGKGIDGYYYCPGIDEGYRITVYRNAIETGYLQIIFRGGIISLVLLGLAAIPALFAGLFDSKNMLVKGSAVYIFLFATYSYPMTISWFILSIVLIWISIIICLDKNIRNMTDEEIELALKEA